MLNARTLLTSTALESRTWEELALGNAAIQIDVPRQIITKLLQIHWTWIAPMFNWVYRPAFMRESFLYPPPFVKMESMAHPERQAIWPVVGRATLRFS